MRWHVGVILFSVAACGTDQPSCDSLQWHLAFQAVDTTPNEYAGSDTSSSDQPHLAVGGTERYKIVGIDNCGTVTGPGRVGAYSGDPSLATVTQTGATIDIRGVAPGVVDVGVVEEFGMSAHLSVPVRAIESVRLVADEVGAPGAFVVGIPQVKVQLLAQGQWLVDRGLTVAGDIPQGSAWNELDTAGAAVGDHPLTVNAGGTSWPVTARIVDHIDDIVAGTPTNGPINRSQELCFHAHTDGAEVGGVPFVFDIEMDGGAAVGPNCVRLWPRDMTETSTTITAHALGLSITTTVMFPR